MMLLVLLALFFQIAPSTGVDLWVYSGSMDPLIVTETFSASSCAVQEGMLPQPGTYKLLRFNTQTVNIGSRDLNLDKPQAGDPNYEFFTCHNHWHFKNYAEFRLRDAAGAVVGVGHKQSFCIEDMGIYYDFARHQNSPHVRFTCDNQGLSSGWYDWYDGRLDGQWIVIDNVPPGVYTLEVEINPLRVLAESNYANNVSTFQVVIP
jgi:hypothetical protein